MKQLYVKDTGARIVGTSEWIPGRADVEGFEENLSNPTQPVPVYTGNTEVFWDGQQTETLDDEILYECEDGHQWTIASLVFCEEADAPPRVVKGATDDVAP